MKCVSERARRAPRAGGCVEHLEPRERREGGRQRADGGVYGPREMSSASVDVEAIATASLTISSCSRRRITSAWSQHTRPHVACESNRARFVSASPEGGAPRNSATCSTRSPRRARGGRGAAQRACSRSVGGLHTCGLAPARPLGGGHEQVGGEDGPRPRRGRRERPRPVWRGGSERPSPIRRQPRPTTRRWWEGRPHVRARRTARRRFGANADGDAALPAGAPSAAPPPARRAAPARRRRARRARGHGERRRRFPRREAAPRARKASRTRRWRPTRRRRRACAAVLVAQSTAGALSSVGAGPPPADHPASKRVASYRRWPSAISSRAGCARARRDRLLRRRRRRQARAAAGRAHCNRRGRRHRLRHPRRRRRHPLLGIESSGQGLSARERSELRRSFPSASYHACATSRATPPRHTDCWAAARA